MPNNSAALNNMVTSYIANEEKISDLAGDLKELRKIKKSMVVDIIAEMRDSGREEIQVGDRVFTLASTLEVSKSKK